jgi:TetR/AcrR family transcriptional repressor of nem operon
MSKETTKNALLEAGKRIFLERGYNHAGIESILQMAGVPKGSFYFYLRIKEDFGLQVLNLFDERRAADIDRYLSDTSLGPLDRLRRLGEATCERLESQQCRNGCLVGNLSLEMADQSEAFRARLDEIFRGWSERFAVCFREAQEAGEISDDLDANELAEFWLNSWQGAVLRAKTLRSTMPLKTFLNQMFEFVLKKRDGVSASIR